MGAVPYEPAASKPGQLSLVAAPLGYGFQKQNARIVSDASAVEFR
jgi:hypothetical protein